MSLLDPGLQEDAGSHPSTLLRSNSTRIDLSDAGISSSPAVLRNGEPQVQSEVRRQERRSQSPARISGPPSIKTYLHADPIENAPKDEPVFLCPGQRAPLRGPMPKFTRKLAKRNAQNKDIDRNTARPVIRAGSQLLNRDERDHTEHDCREEEGNVLNRPQTSRNPLDYYGQPQQRPEPWGWQHCVTGECKFRYSEHGGLEVDQGFSRTELQEYFYARALPRSSSSGHYAEDKWVERQTLPGEKQITGKQRHGLTLWIGWAPAQKHERFPTDIPNKCCFRDCPVERKFRGGQPRVTFDERMNVHGLRDPYHVAAYMHLFCLEQQLDILKLMKDIDIRLDARRFLKEDNITGFESREHGEIKLDAACRWLAEEWLRKEQWDTYLERLRRDRDAMPGLPRLTRKQTSRPRNFDDSLTKAMVVSDVENYGSSGKASRLARRKSAAQRGRRIIKDAPNHLGNLEWCRDQSLEEVCRSPPRRLWEGRSFRRDETLVTHNVYDLADFTDGFVPARRGHSSWDAFGIRGKPFQYPELAPARVPTQRGDHGLPSSILPPVEVFQHLGHASHKSMPYRAYAPPRAIEYSKSGNATHENRYPLRNIQPPMYPSSSPCYTLPTAPLSVTSDFTGNGFSVPVLRVPTTAAINYPRIGGLKREREDTGCYFDSDTLECLPISKRQRIEDFDMAAPLWQTMAPAMPQRLGTGFDTGCEGIAGLENVSHQAPGSDINPAGFPARAGTGPNTIRRNRVHCDMSSQHTQDEILADTVLLRPAPVEHDYLPSKKPRAYSFISSKAETSLDVALWSEAARDVSDRMKAYNCIYDSDSYHSLHSLPNNFFEADLTWSEPATQDYSNIGPIQNGNQLFSRSGVSIEEVRGSIPTSESRLTQSAMNNGVELTTQQDGHGLFDEFIDAQTTDDWNFFVGLDNPDGNAVVPLEEAVIEQIKFAEPDDGLCQHNDFDALLDASANAGYSPTVPWSPYLGINLNAGATETCYENYDKSSFSLGGLPRK